MSGRLASRAAVAGLLAWVLVVPASAVAQRLADAVLAEVQGEGVTLSDVALARRLGLLGFASPPGPAPPVTAPDVERMIVARLVLAEASTLGVVASPEEIDARWRAVAAPFGGVGGLEAWLAERGIERDWARRLVAADVLRERFVDLRFRAFAFVGPEELARALGPGPHDAAAEERARARLREQQTDAELAAWTRERLGEVRVRRLLDPGRDMPVPFE